MPHLSLPEEVNVHLRTTWGPLPVADVLIGVRLFARHKNDFFLGPYPTNAKGVATFSKRDLLADVRATQDSGLMDYASVDDCQESVQVSIFTPEQISNGLAARTKAWGFLLKGEQERWKSISELLELYRRAEVVIQTITGQSLRPMHANWSETASRYEYDFIVELI